MLIYIPNGDPEPTTFADANTQQTFVDVLDNEVIKNLTTLKVSHKDLVLAGILVLIWGHMEGIE